MWLYAGTVFFGTQYFRLYPGGSLPGWNLSKWLSMHASAINVQSMQQNKSNRPVFMVAVAAAVLVISQASFQQPGTRPSKEEQATAPAKVPLMPASISFAGEAVPLDRWEVRERLDRELLYISYNTPNVLYTIKLAGRYLPVISARLKANGVPDDFKYMCVAESNLEPAAISRSGAVSFWQFMDYTAPGYQLTVNAEIDQRYDLEKATDAACRYIKDAYRRFGSWTAAAASYNCGMGRFNGLARFQQTNNYYDLYLPEETNRYIFRILTFKHVMENAGALGFQVAEKDPYRPVPFKTFEVNASIPDLAKFAVSKGTNYKMLKLLNPWLKGRSLTVTGNRRYQLKLPA